MLERIQETTVRDRKTVGMRPGTPRTPMRRSLIADKSVHTKEELARRNKLVKNRIYMLQYDNQLARTENMNLQNKYDELEKTTKSIIQENERLKAEKQKLTEENAHVSQILYNDSK